jgi:hypothetical protein
MLITLPTWAMNQRSIKFHQRWFLKKKIINVGTLLWKSSLLLVEQDGTACSLCLPMHAQPNQFKKRQEPSNIDALTHVPSSCKVITELVAVEIRKTLRV